jgi:hypothetical protein
MSAASAKVIDFQAYRSSRQAQQAATVSDMPIATMMPGMTAMAWVPVWFVPVFFIGSGHPAH